MVTNYVDYDYWVYGYCEGDTRFVDASAVITANATVTAKGKILGEEWSDIPFGTNTWTDATVIANTWIDLTPSSDTWTPRILQFYVDPNYWVDGYTLDLENVWTDVTVTTNTWLQQG